MGAFIVGFLAIGFAIGIVPSLVALDFGRAISGALFAFLFYKWFKRIRNKTAPNEEERLRREEEVAKMGEQIKAGFKRVASAIEGAAESAERQKKEKLSRIANIDRENTIGKRIYVTVLGGTNLESKKDSQLTLWVSEDAFVLSEESSSFEMRIPLSAVARLNISGPGKVTTNMGVSGGGFGVEGALEGMAVATAINTLTTNTSVKTILHISTENAEFWLQSKAEPEKLRMILSRAFLVVENNKSPVRQTTIAQEIKELALLKDQGVLTEEEYTKAKKSIIEKNGPSNI